MSLVLLQAACSSDSAGTERTAGESVSTEDLPVLPSSSILIYADSDTALVRDLVNRNVSQCMTDAGFTFAWRPMQLDIPRRDEMRYGLVPSEWQVGETYSSQPEIEYQETPSPPADPQAMQNYSVVLSGSQEETLRASVSVSGGTSTFEAPAGCYGSAIAEVFGTRQAFLDFQVSQARVFDFSNRSLAALLSDDGFVAAKGVWIDCMAAAGHSYDDIFSPFGDSFASDAVAQDVAREDIACKRQARIEEIGTAFEASWQERNLPDVAGDLEALRQFHDTIVSKYQNL